MSPRRARTPRPAESADTESLDTESLDTVPEPRPSKLGLARLRIEPRRSRQDLQGAQQILLDARAEAHSIVEGARGEAKQIREQATAAGRKEGLAALAGQRIRLNHERARYQESSMEASVELARLLAERILGSEIEQRPEHVGNMAREVLRNARTAGQITLYAHQLDLPLLEECRGSLGIDDADLDLHESVDCARGEVIVESELGLLDGRFAVQLEHLLKQLMGPAGLLPR